MSVTTEKIGDFLEEVRLSKYYLPAIQRELVWGMDRIERLFDSLLRGYPVVAPISPAMLQLKMVRRCDPVQG